MSDAFVTDRMLLEIKIFYQQELFITLIYLLYNTLHFILNKPKYLLIIFKSKYC